MNKIYIIGLGGIGSWLIEPLLRFVKFKGFNPEIHLIDGDSYSTSNLTRQSIHPHLVGMNKASATALRMRQYFPEFKFIEHPIFLDALNIDSIIKDNDILIYNCCDNNYCRKLVAYKANDLRNITLFTGGNEITDGNSHVFSRGYAYGNKNVMESHPEVKDALSTEDRGSMSCNDIANLPSSNQIVITNFWCAAIMLQQTYLYLSGNKNIQETFFDIKRSSINAIENTK